MGKIIENIEKGIANGKERAAAKSGLDASFDNLRSAIKMVVNVLERDAKEKPVRGEMAEQLLDDFGKFSDEFEAEIKGQPESERVMEDIVVVKCTLASDCQACKNCSHSQEHEFTSKPRKDSDEPFYGWCNHGYCADKRETCKCI